MTTTLRYPETPGHKGTATSRAAADAMKKHDRPLREKCVSVFRSFPEGLTADEVAERLDEDVVSIRPRISQLKKLGAIVPTGETRPSSLGSPSEVMRYVPPALREPVTPAPGAAPNAKEAGQMDLPVAPRAEVENKGGRKCLLYAGKWGQSIREGKTRRKLLPDNPGLLEGDVVEVWIDKGERFERCLGAATITRIEVLVIKPGDRWRLTGQKEGDFCATTRTLLLGEMNTMAEEFGCKFGPEAYRTFERKVAARFGLPLNAWLITFGDLTPIDWERT